MEKRIFIITWRENKKNSLERYSTITVTKVTGDIGQDAKTALNIFCSVNGNLKKNEVISIQEVDEQFYKIGEPIIPTGDNSVVPYKK